MPCTLILLGCKLQKSLCLVRDDLLDCAIAEEARRRFLSYFRQRITRWSKHELPSVKEQFPERVIKRPEKHDQLLQLTVRPLAEKCCHLCVLSRLFVREKFVPHVPIV
jgi:hypothetical protein